jgi:hypothetical protein
MKKFLLIASILLATTVSKAGDNIVSFVVGSQVGTNSSGVSGSSSTTTTTNTNNPNSHANDNAQKSETSTSSSAYSAAVPGDSQQVITGILYQRRVEHNSPVLLGILLQSNQTMSATMGVEF